MRKVLDKAIWTFGLCLLLLVGCGKDDLVNEYAKSIKGQWVDVDVLKVEADDKEVHYLEIEESGKVLDVRLPSGKKMLFGMMDKEGVVTVSKDTLAVLNDEFNDNSETEEVDYLSFKLEKLKAGKLELKMVRAVVNGKVVPMDQLGPDSEDERSIFERASSARVNSLKEHFAALKKKNEALREKLKSTAWELVEERSTTGENEPVVTKAESIGAKSERTINGKTVIVHHLKHFELLDENRLLVNKDFESEYHLNWKKMDVNLYESEEEDWYSDMGDLVLEDETLTMKHEYESSIVIGNVKKKIKRVEVKVFRKVD